MLEALRSFVSGWTAKILLILLVGSFALWGVSGSILGGADTNTVATVGETKVSIREFLNTYNRNIADLQRQAGRRITRDEGRIFGIEQRSLSSVVAAATMDEFAREQNLALSDETLARLIAETPAFQDSTGKFNRETFRQAIYQAQMQESEFIDIQNKSAIRGQMSRSFATDNILPETFKNAMNEFANVERNFKFITLKPTNVDKPADPSAEQLKTYFEANKATYKAPEYRKLDILSLTPEIIADESAVTDEQVKADYDERKESYRTQEKRRIQQIVFKSQEKADAAVKALQEGAFFETVLTDNELKAEDVDLGLLQKSQLPNKALQEAAFAAELNTPTAVVKGPFGPTMLRITEVTAETVTPLEEVKDDIRKDLALRTAADSIITMQETIEDMRAGGSLLKDIASNLNLKLRSIDALDQTARTSDETVITDIPESRVLIQKAFATEVGVQGSPIDIGSTGYVWFDVLEITPTRDRTQEEVADKLKADWIAAEQAAAVTAKAKDFKTRLEKGASIDSLALDVNALAEETGLVKRSSALPNFPRSATLAGFSGGSDYVAVTNGAKDGEKIVLQVVEEKQLEGQAIQDQADAFAQANSGAADDLLTQMIVKLQSRYSATQNPAAVNHALTQFR